MDLKDFEQFKTRNILVYVSQKGAKKYNYYNLPRSIRTPTNDTHEYRNGRYVHRPGGNKNVKLQYSNVTLTLLYFLRTVPNIF